MNAHRLQRKGSAQHATYQRDAALSALDEWMSDFMRIARVALDDRPSFLEKLGVTVRQVRRTENQEPRTA